jgi:hypothetical protein
MHFKIMFNCAQYRAGKIDTTKTNNTSSYTGAIQQSIHIISIIMKKKPAA